MTALIEHLKKVFGWNAQTTGDGIVSITERGNGVCTMHKVLTDFWERHPENSVLRKWIFNVLKGVENTVSVATAKAACTLKNNITVAEAFESW